MNRGIRGLPHCRPGLFMSRCAYLASTGVLRVVEAFEARCGIFTKASCAWMQIGVAKGDDGWASMWIVQRIGVIRLTSKRGRNGLASVLQRSGERRSVLFWCFCPAHARQCLAASRRHLSAGCLTRFQSHSQRVPAGHRLDSFICSLLQPLAAC